MPQLSAKREMQDGRDVVRLCGNVLAGAGEVLRAASAPCGKDVVFNWSGVTITSSEGIREWVYFLNDFAVGRQVAFSECPPSIVVTFNMIPHVLGPARVTSAYGTFVCRGCGKERWELLVVGKDVAADGVIHKQVCCDGCQGAMELNVPEAEFFAFMLDG